MSKCCYIYFQQGRNNIKYLDIINKHDMCGGEVTDTHDPKEEKIGLKIKYLTWNSHFKDLKRKLNYPLI